MANLLRIVALAFACLASAVPSASADDRQNLALDLMSAQHKSEAITAVLPKLIQ